MKCKFHLGLAVFAWAALHSEVAGAQTSDEGGGPSRAQLFSLFVRTPAEADLGILGSALPFSFRFPLHVRDDGIFGIDVSHHNEDFCNCQIDWNVVSNQKISFAYLKATQGALFRDKKFINNWNTLGKHPSIHRGAYHFLSAMQDPIDQAKNFLSLVGTLDAKDMPPCLDIEWDLVSVDEQQRDAWTNLTSDQIVDRALKWLKEVETTTGRIPIIYTSNAWWKGRIQEDKMALFERYPIWIADYSTKGLGEEKPNVPKGRTWAMWQFIEKGVLEQGLPGNVDANIFKGTLDEFRQAFGIVLTSTMPTTPTSTTTTPINTPNSPTGGSTAPNSPPKKDASVAPPKSGNTNPTTSPNNAATRNTQRRPKNSVNDDSFGFYLRGSSNVRVE